jgi:hypothetical protein
LPHEQFFGDAGQVLFEHQRFENHQQVHVDATQIVTVHGHVFLFGVGRFCGWALRTLLD